MTIPARYTLTEAHFRIAELETELARLEQERDHWKGTANEMAENEIPHLVTRVRELRAEVTRLQALWQQETERAIKAEGINWDKVQEVTRLTQQGEIASGVIAELTKTCEFWQAEVTRLREGLRPLAPLFVELDDMSLSLTDERIDELRDQIVAIARSLLADNQEASEPARGWECEREDCQGRPA